MTKRHKDYAQLLLLPSLCQCAGFNTIIMAFRTGKSLKKYFLRSKKLDQKTLHEVYDLWEQNFNGKKSYTDFVKSINNYDYTAIMRDHSASGKLCAMASYRTIPTDLKINSRKIFIIKPGSIFVLPEYQRSGFTHKFLLDMTLREKLLRPFTPLYMIEIFLTYSFYPVFFRFAENTYPRYDRPTPKTEQKVLDYYIENCLDYGYTYDPERCVLQLPRAVKKELGAIDEKHLKNPHVKYYAERTNWEKGEALLGVTNVSWKVIASLYNNWK